MTTFHNTTNESGIRLQGYEQQAETQDQKVASFFELNPGEIWTPWEIQSIVFKVHTPITSVRRSMNTLARAGILDKTEHLKETGSYGRRSYCWRLNESYRESMELMVFADKDEVGELLAELDLELAPQDTPGGHVNTITPSDAPEGHPGRKSTDGANTDPQRKLFNVPPMQPRPCIVCGRILTDPRSIIKGMGPVCFGKCREGLT